MLFRSPLKEGNPEALVEYWQYFLTREKGDFQITRCDDGKIELEIRECPAIRRLQEIGLDVNPDFCLQTKMLNDAWSDGTPWVITTEKTGAASCRQTIARRKEADHESRT